VRRRKLIAAAAGVLCVLVTLAVRLELDSPRATQESFARVREAMTLAEVEAILGPPGDYTTGPTRGLYPPNLSIPLCPVRWRTDEGLFWVEVAEISPSSRVIRRKFWPDDPPAPRPVYNFFWRAERQWRLWFPEK
jgi:hypothetical protein